MSDPEAWPAPAREELDKPPLDAEDLERETGDSEPGTKPPKKAATTLITEDR